MSGTLSRHSSRKRGALRPHAQLFVALACDAPLDHPARISLDGLDLVHVGRGESPKLDRQGGKLQLRLVDGRMSTQHARLVYAGGTWILEDQGSKNGVLVDGLAVERVTLTDGCLFELGHTFFLYREVIAPEEHLTTVFGRAARAPHPSLTSMSSPLAAAHARLAQIAASHVAVLLQGESGTGKEVAARAVHALSNRPGRFIAVNCGALAENLVQSELFGYRRGAFSGADEDRMGLVRSADGGTLFLDEIGDLPPSAQAVLLRVLQEKEVTPVGSSEAVVVDVRFIAATHRELDDMMDAGTFRRDLHARLAGFEFGLRPLRERREDLGLLIGDLLQRHGARRGEDGAGRAIALAPEAARALFDHAWPLNIRELEQCLASALALCPDGWIDVEHLSKRIRRVEPSVTARPAKLSPEDELIRGQVMAALTESGGNISAAARVLDKDRKQLHRWVKRFGIDVAQFR